MAILNGAQQVRAALRAPLAENAEPIRLAECFRKTHFEIEAHATLVRWARAWWKFDGVRFVEIDDELLWRNVYQFLDVVEVEKRTKDGDEWKCHRERVTAKTKTANELLRALLKVMPSLGPNVPQWTQRFADDPPPEALIPCANGLLDISSLRLIRPTPRLFATNALGTAWDPTAEATAWLSFLSSMWGDDRESIRVLQQMFGYFLTGDTSQQKLFALVGPKRSGKGTISRVLTALLGGDAVVHPTLASLERPFGMAPFVGKLLAIVGDARLGGRQDQATVVERLLSVSGEDPMSIDRKNREPIDVRLRTRVLLITNELPRLYDTSGALASRFVILTMTRSFYGDEDAALERKLLAELPGILRWAIEGRQDLAESGRFVVPLTSAQAIADLEAISSPMTVFIRDAVVLDSKRQIEVGLLYERWCSWCKTNGREPGNKQVFCRDLRTVIPDLKDGQRSKLDGSRVRVYEGIGVN